MEGITREEELAGSQPSRVEKIMYTPLEEVLAKSSWDDVDIEILVANRHVLDAETLAKIGITAPTPLSPEEVNAATASLGPVPEEPVATPEAPVAEVPLADAATPEMDAPVGEVSTGEQVKVDEPA